MAVGVGNDTIDFADTTLGPFAGLLSAPREGFRWVVGWRPGPNCAAAPQPLGWLVQNDTDGFVHNERYPALRAERCRDLHRKFARLARVRPERRRDAILTFANRYGWLGSRDDRCLLTPPRPNDGSGNWGYTPDTREGEPWRLWDAAIPEAAALVALWDLVQREERGTLDRFLT